FWSHFVWTIAWTVICVTLTYSTGLALAMLMNQRLRGRSLYRLMLILPWAVPTFVTIFSWRLMLADGGVVNGLLGSLGLPERAWLSDPLAQKAAAILVNTWVGFPFMMLSLLGGLQSIPGELYEAAEIDGAGQWRIVAAIKLPAIRGALVIATIFSIIGSFQLFNEPSILQGLAPNAITTSYTPNLYTYSLSFARQQHDYAATVAIVMGLITMVIAYVVQLRGMRKAA
ncbi:sugar ABC transporter permease, partial [Kitasatospora nipponensis]|uniref:carbohydrate ABC transporter permease n=1 Tax=Kitasatospora nipponensis TaxID=258049 RepID=UPI0031D34EA9